MAGRGRGIVIDLVANTREFITGTRKAGDSLDDFSDDLTQVARDGDRAGEKLEQSFKDVADVVNRTGDEVASAGKAKIGGAGAEIGQEFSQNFGEAVRSGNPAGAILETVTSLGPAFGLAGIALAAGAGIANSVIQGIKDAEERLRKAGSDMWEALQDGILDAKERQQGLVSALGVDDLEGALDKIAKLAADTGIPIAALADYLTTGVDPSGKIAAALGKAADATARANANRDAGQVTVSNEVLAAQEIADARERYEASQRRGLELITREEAVARGINGEIERRIQLQAVLLARWQDPAYQAAYARSGDNRDRP